MEENDLGNIKEWSLLSDLLNKIPAKVKRGLFSCDLNITCVDVVPEFIAIGTDGGLVFWYNRKNGNLQRLKCESSTQVTCIKIVSTVEYMVAAGCTSGEVNVFQIQKEHPPDLNLEPLTKPKPIERYTIRDLHHSPVRCVEWSKNGMKLYSGDKHGIIVLTEFDYQMHISKSVEILNEAYDIVQIAYLQPWLLISSVYRAIICERETDGKWKVSQIGKKDRKMLSDFGAAFRGSTKNPSIISSRPGFRFWVSDTKGNVSQTLLFKDALTKISREVPLLNPGRLPVRLPMNFGRAFVYKEKYILTWNENIIYILNIDKLTVETTVRRLRGIIDISICGAEIFVLEGPRSLVRISTNPDILNFHSNKIFYNPALSSIIPSENQVNLFEPVIEIEIDEDAVVNAEECFELPPIRHIELDIPIERNVSSGDEQNDLFLKQEQLFLDHSKKVEIYDKINSLKYDDSVVFKSGILNRKHHHDSLVHKNGKQRKKKTAGIVEIGKLVGEESERPAKHLPAKVNILTTKPCLLNISFCDSPGCVPDLRSPETIKRDIEKKEKILAETLDIPAVHLEKLDTPVKSPDDGLLSKIAFPLTSNVDINCHSEAPHSTPLKKLHFINDEESPTSDDEKILKDSSCNTKQMNNLCDDIKNIMIKSDITSYQTAAAYNDIEYNLPSTSTSSSVYISSNAKTPDFIPDLKKMPEFMNIPNLWNVTIERTPDDEVSEGVLEKNFKNRKSSEQHSDGSDWEFV